MLFKNSFHLLIDNFALNYKMLLYKVLVWVLGIALSAAQQRNIEGWVKDDTYKK